MLVVFLNNKLISCDTIIPVIRELHDKHKLKNIELVCFDNDTFVAIRNNVVLSDAIYSIGNLKMIGRKDKDRETKIVIYFKIMPHFLKYFYLGFIKKITFLHFKELDKWPLKIFSKLFPSSTILSQSTTEGYRSLEEKVSEMMMPRIYEDYKPMGNTILAYDKDWAVLKNKDYTRKKKIVFLASPHKRRNWIDYIEKKQSMYFKKEFKENKLTENEKIVAFMLCWMGPNNLTRTPNMYPKLFDETLHILKEVCSDYTIFVKPHPTSINSLSEMKNIKTIIKKHQDINIVLTKLHPIILSYRARFFIANTFSTSFSSARISNVPTIEYTDYSKKILKTTKFGSMRPDLVSYFINHDSQKLKSIINNIKNRKTRNIMIDDSPMPKELLKIINDRL